MLRQREKMNRNPGDKTPINKIWKEKQLYGHFRTEIEDWTEIKEIQNREHKNSKKKLFYRNFSMADQSK